MNDGGTGPQCDGQALARRGERHRAAGRLAEARRDFEDALAILRQSGDVTTEDWVLERLATLPPRPPLARSGG